MDKKKRGERKREFSELLKYWMTWRHMTAADLQYSTGMTREQIYKYLHARTLPAEKNMSRLCRALCISQERFYNPKGMSGDGFR